MKQRVVGSASESRRGLVLEPSRHLALNCSQSDLRSSLSRSVSGQVPLVPPDTEGVRQQLVADGPSTTLMDVAKGIISRLLENPELEVAAWLGPGPTQRFW